MAHSLYQTTGFIRDGLLHLRNAKTWKDTFQRWKDGPVTITVEKQHATRSLAQNAYWHGVVVKLFADHCGYYPDEMHELLKLHLLPKKRYLHNEHGEIIGEHVVGGSTRVLNKIEFGELIEKAQQLGAEMGIVIPNPNEALI